MSISARTRDWAELWIGYGLILVVVWTPNPWQRVLYWTAVAFIAVTAWLRRRETQPNGFGLKGLVASLWIIPGAVAAVFAAIDVAGHLHTLHPLYGPLPVVAHILAYALWALVQQFILQVFVLLRLLRLGLRRGAAITLAAVLFAIAHIPNPVLVPITLVWGAATSVLYLRYRNLYALALAHGILGMGLAVCVPNSVHHHMRVGLGYLEYRTHQHWTRGETLIIPR
ncbi:MAG TPA: CPBP family intramembrane glutamic endopeptidase [Acidobacteriaceae bacterium]|nr:CPBP family intramembrane glutamic endopeptidase [Acidobacteriaceae bacterium]